MNPFKSYLVFCLRLGLTGFGGPIAMLGEIRKEIQKFSNGKLTEKDFDRMLTLAKIFPGPLATLMVLRIGTALHPKTIALIGGFFLIFPAFLMMFFSAKYESQFDFLNHLIFPGLALGTLSAVRFALPYRKHVLPLFASGMFTFLFPRYEWIVIVLPLIYFLFIQPKRVYELLTPLALFTICFQSALTSIGSGVAMVPTLKGFMVDRGGYLTTGEFLKALAVGQLTPGPLVIFTSYIGAKTLGFWGAIASLVGTFLPTFIFGVYLLPKLDQALTKNERFSTGAEKIFPWVSGAILGAMGSLIEMSLIQEFNPLRVVGFLMCFIFMAKTKLPSFITLALGGVLFWALKFLG